jgi:hypothetical protein
MENEQQVPCNIDPLNSEQITTTELALLRDKIQNLPKKHHVDIFKIFFKYNCDFSENKNGIFINLSQISMNIIKELYNHITYIETQEAQLNILEDEKDKYKQLLTTPHST